LRKEDGKCNKLMYNENKERWHQTTRERIRIVEQQSKERRMMFERDFMRKAGVNSGGEAIWQNKLGNVDLNVNVSQRHPFPHHSLPLGLPSQPFPRTEEETALLPDRGSDDASSECPRLERETWDEYGIVAYRHTALSGAVSRANPYL